MPELELTPAEKVIIVKENPQAKDPIASLVEATIPSETEVKPEYVGRQSWSYHFYEDPVLMGEKIEVVILRGGKEVAHMTHDVVERIPEGMELRPFINYGPTVCAMFTVSK